MAVEKYKVWIFDLDGTLTLSKKPIDIDMATALANLLDAGAMVAIVSGGGFPQFKKQVIIRLQDFWEGEAYRRFRNMIMQPLNGCEVYVFDGAFPGEWRRAQSSDFTEDEKKRIVSALMISLERANWKPRNPTFGEIIEDRGSQITFSALGQEAPLNLKRTYDPDQRIRLHIKMHLDTLLPDFEVRLGGTTSIDINRRGFDKARAVEMVMSLMPRLPLDAYLFVGDALYEGGNDEPVKRVGIATIHVSNPVETRQVIRRLLDDRI